MAASREDLLFGYINDGNFEEFQRLLGDDYQIVLNDRQILKALACAEDPRWFVILKSLQEKLQNDFNQIAQDYLFPEILLDGVLELPQKTKSIGQLAELKAIDVNKEMSPAFQSPILPYHYVVKHGAEHEKNELINLLHRFGAKEVELVLDNPSNIVEASREQLKTFLEAKKELTAIKDHQDQNVMHYLFKRRFISRDFQKYINKFVEIFGNETMKQLLESRDKQGKTPLHYLHSKGEVLEIALGLYKKTNATIAIEDNKGISAINEILNLPFQLNDKELSMISGMLSEDYKMPPARNVTSFFTRNINKIQENHPDKKTNSLVSSVDKVSIYTFVHDTCLMAWHRVILAKLKF